MKTVSIQVAPEADKPTINGNTYPKYILREAINKFHKFDSPLTCNMSGVRSLEQASHTVLDIQMDEDGIITAEIHFLDTPAGHLLHDLFITTDISSGLCSTAEIDSDKVISDQTITGVGFYPEPQGKS